MKVIFLDLDTLRPDHLGCYGYKRNTSPNIDTIAKEGIVFDKYYCPNAPCLPSRASLISGRFGIHTGIVGHGGTAADMRLQGESRDFTDDFSYTNLFNIFRRAGFRTASINSFAERHSAWWFNAGFDETHNIGKKGWESAEEVTPFVEDFLDRNKDKDNWLLHINYWDAHTPYRTPEEFGNPFKNEGLPHNWIDETVFDKHKMHVGPHGVNEINMWTDNEGPWPRHPGRINNLDEVKEFMDNYDCGIAYMDAHIGRIIEMLKAKNLYEDTTIIITSDHGENMGELGLYGEHATADEPTCRIPMIIKWVGGQKGIRNDKYHTNVDLVPTVAELLNVSKYSKWDGKSFRETITEGKNMGDEYVVLTQCAHVCQRSVRFDDYIYIRNYHTGFHLFEKEMLFNLKKDPFEQNNIAEEEKDICEKGAKLILDWVDEMMIKSDSEIDPLYTVLKEGGPYHTWGAFDSYIERLKNTGREYGVEQLKSMFKNYR